MFNLWLRHFIFHWLHIYIHWRGTSACVKDITVYLKQFPTANLCILLTWCYFSFSKMQSGMQMYPSCGGKIFRCRHWILLFFSQLWPTRPPHVCTRNSLVASINAIRDIPVHSMHEQLLSLRTLNGNNRDESKVENQVARKRQLPVTFTEQMSHVIAYEDNKIVD